MTSPFTKQDIEAAAKVLDKGSPFTTIMCELLAQQMIDAAYASAQQRGADGDIFKEPLPASLLAKIGAIVVHAEEFLSPDGHTFDAHALGPLVVDAEVQAFVTALGPLAPLKRKSAT